MKAFLLSAVIIGLLVPIAGCQQFDRELAPIENVEIEISDPDPMSRVKVNVTYGLPDGCYSFEGVRVVEISDGFDIGIWLKKPKSAQACTEIYRTESTSIELGRSFQPGQNITIRVNGVERRITIPDQSSNQGDVLVKPAPIVSAKVRIAESFPPQVFVDIKGVLTDGCTTLKGTDVQRQGNLIDIAVTTQRPRDAVCIQIVSYFDVAIPLGSNFIAGQQYTLRVNGQSQQFTVDSGASTVPTAPDRDTPIPPTR